MKRIKSTIRNLLLAFVLISIGFVLGKNFSYKNENRSTLKQSVKSVENGCFVDVYYFHSTFRCSTCNKIEKMTENLLKSEFSKQLDNKKIKYMDVNFQEDEMLAKQYEVVASCVVIVLKQNKKILKYRRLDEVWTLVDNQKKFKDHISKVIRNYLNSLSETSKGK